MAPRKKKKKKNHEQTWHFLSLNHMHNNLANFVLSISIVVAYVGANNHMLTTKVIKSIYNPAKNTMRVAKTRRRGSGRRRIELEDGGEFIEYQVSLGL
jgi:hypothetical protein